MFRRLQYIVDSISQVFFPVCCPVCGKVLPKDYLRDLQPEICPECINCLPHTEQAAQRDNNTEQLFYKEEQFSRGAAFLFFQKNSVVQDIVHAFKYGHRPALAYRLAHAAAMDFMQADFFDEIDVIVPVPLHPRRLRQRGYNQSEWIARALGDATGIPVDTSHVLRVRNNPKQALKHGKDRATNVADIFQVNHPEEWYRKHILLVDDVITTGSTLLSCMQAMHVCRGCRISVFALARAH